MHEGDELVQKTRMMCHVLVMPFEECSFSGDVFHVHEEGHNSRHSWSSVAQMHDEP